jgi:hypothetical protein
LTFFRAVAVALRIGRDRCSDRKEKQAMIALLVVLTFLGAVTLDHLTHAPQTA